MTEPTPTISIVVPMWNEVSAIVDCLDGFDAQEIDHDRFEVLVVDGRSDDGSRELVERYADAHPWVRPLDNPARRIPAACNIGLAAARGRLVCFFSAHGVPDPDFVERTIAVLDESGATGVGGRYRHEGLSPASLSIGLAMASPVGMASPHRFATERREVDTIGHPAYDTEAVRAVGGFDESMQRNEDYELNWRLREAGGVLIFDPSIGSVYRPRASLRLLARQFFWYGAFKAKMLREHPRSVQARHLVPPLTVLGAIAAVPLSFQPRWRALVAVTATAYSTIVLVGARSAIRSERGADRRVLVTAFPVMHLAWGSGFLVGMLGWEGS